MKATHVSGFTMNLKKIAGWIAAGLLGLLILTAAATLLLRSSAFHRFLIGKLERSASASLGTVIQIEELDFSLSNLSVDLSGIVIHGNEVNSQQPLLSIRHVGAEFKIISLLRRQWHLNTLIVDHPVIHISVDKSGSTNIPQISKRSQTNVFDLAVRHAAIKSGEIYYDNQESALNADLQDLAFEAGYDSTESSYDGTLHYRDGRLQFRQYTPLPHNLSARFHATRTRFKLDPLQLAVGSSRVDASASLENYAAPKISGRYEAVVIGDDFRHALGTPSIPSGTVKLAGTLTYQSVRGHAPIESLALDGSMSSSALQIEDPRFRTEIRDVSARYEVANGNASVPELRARVLGGELNGKLTMQDLNGESRTRLKATLRGTSLSELELLVPAEATKDVNINGKLDAMVDAQWVRAFEGLAGNADISLESQVSSKRAQAGITSVPLDAAIHARYVDAKKQFTLSKSQIRSQQTLFQFDGTVSDHSSLRIAMQSHDLHELEMLAAMFRSATGEPLQALNLHGTASFQGEMRGPIASPDLSGEVSGSHISIKDSSWRMVRARVQANPAKIAVNNGYAAPETQGEITFGGEVGLDRWSYRPDNPVKIAMKASQLSAAEIARLAGAQAYVSGVLNAEIEMHGSRLNPRGVGHVLLSKAVVMGEPVQRAELHFHGDGNSLTGTGEVRLPAGSAHSEFQYYPRQQSYEAMLKATNLQLGQLKALQRRKVKVAGALSLQATGKGTLTDPGLQATLTIPQLQVHDQFLRGVRLHADVLKHLATVDLTTESMNGVRAHGTVVLANGYQADLKVDTGALPLQPLIAAYAPERADDFTGKMELHATVVGPLTNPLALEAHALIPTFNAKYKTLQFGAVKPVKVDYANGVIEIHRSEIRGTETDLEFQGTIPLDGRAPSSVLLRGNVNLRLLQVLQPGLTSSGQLQINVDSFGERNEWNPQGEIRIVNASLVASGAPVGLQNGNGVLTLRNKRVDITSFQGQVGGGTVSARGGVAFSPHVQFDLAISGNEIQVLYPQGVRSSLDTNLTFAGNMQAAYLRGQVNVERISFTSDFDLSRFDEQMSGATVAPATGFSNDIHLSVAVQTPSGLDLVGRTLSLQGGANLRVQGTASHPVILGRTDITGGDVIFLSNRYEIQGGTVAFANPTQTEAIVNITATTSINEYNINLRLEGPLDRLRTNYTSDPSLPPADIISLIAFGKTTQSAETSNPSLGGAIGAESVLASGISSQIAGRVQKFAGISQLSIDPVIGATENNHGARIAIQQRVNSNLFVMFSTDVTSTMNQVIQVRYQLSPRWAVAGDRDQNGGFGFNVRLHKEF